MLQFSKIPGVQSAANQIHSLDPRSLNLPSPFIFGPSKELLLMLKFALDSKVDLGKHLACLLDDAYRKDPSQNPKSMVADLYERCIKEKTELDKRCLNALSEFVEIVKPYDKPENNASSRLEKAINVQRELAAWRYDRALAVLEEFNQGGGSEVDRKELIKKLMQLNLKSQPDNPQEINRPLLQAKM